MIVYTKNVIRCPKKHIPRFLILEALQLLTTRRPENTAETIAEKRMIKEFESMKQKTDSKRKKQHLVWSRKQHQQ